MYKIVLKLNNTPLYNNQRKYWHNLSNLSICFFLKYDSYIFWSSAATTKQQIQFNRPVSKKQ